MALASLTALTGGDAPPATYSDWWRPAYRMHDGPQRGLEGAC